MGISLEIETVSNLHYNELIEFLSNFDNETRGSEFWRSRLFFWWDQNPAFSDKIERGWVLKRNDNKKIVGFIGNIPTFFHFKGKQIIVFNATTWRVNNKHRNQSLLLLFKYMFYSKNSIMFNTSPTNDVVNILKKSNFQQLPSLIKKNSFTILRPYSFIRFLKNKRKLLYILAKLTSPILNIYQSIRLMNVYNVNIVKRITKADSQFDLLWEKSKKKYENTNVRTSDIINWYCFGNKNFKKILFGYFKNGELQAYSIFNIVIENKFTKLICSDLWGLKINKKIVKSFCLSAMKYAKGKKIDVVIYPHFDNRLGTFYKRLGLFGKESIGEKYIKTSKENIKALCEKKTYLTNFLGDFGL